MSSTELYSVQPNGDVIYFADVKNSWLGAMFIWNKLSETHLGWDTLEYSMRSFRDARKMENGKKGDLGLQPLWDLWQTDIPRHHKICLMTTLDGFLVRRENLPTLHDALTRFDNDFPNSNLTEQSRSIFREEEDDPDFTAICWSISLVSGFWQVPTDDEEPRPYNINIDTGHHYLFDILKDFEKGDQS